MRALLVSGDPFFDSQRDRLIVLAAHHAIPAIYQWREFPMIGGLMSYASWTGAHSSIPCRIIRSPRRQR
jgi:putative tryptophan/tyrosine transport system substrate-binding protein